MYSSGSVGAHHGRMSHLSLILTGSLVCFAVPLPASEPDLKPNQEGTNSAPGSALTQAARRDLTAFTYDPPPDWTLKPVRGADYKMAYAPNDLATIACHEIEFKGNLGQLESEFLRGAPEGLAAQGWSNFRIISRSPFETASKLAGLQAVTQSQRADQKVVRQVYYFFERNDGRKVCVVCSVVGEDSAHDVEFNSIMKTFRVTN